MVPPKVACAPGGCRTRRAQCNPSAAQSPPGAPFHLCPSLPPRYPGEAARSTPTEVRTMPTNNSFTNIHEVDPRQEDDGRAPPGIETYVQQIKETADKLQRDQVSRADI